MPEADSGLFDHQCEVLMEYIALTNKTYNSALTQGEWADRLADAVTWALNKLSEKDRTEIGHRTFATVLLNWAQDMVAERWFRSALDKTLIRIMLSHIGNQTEQWFRQRGWKEIRFEFSVSTWQPPMIEGTLEENTAESVGPDHDPPEAPKRRGRPPLPPEQKIKALMAKEAGKSLKEQAAILYNTKAPTRRQQSDVSNILRNFQRCQTRD